MLQMESTKAGGYAEIDCCLAQEEHVQTDPSEEKEGDDETKIHGRLPEPLKRQGGTWTMWCNPVETQCRKS